MSILLRNLILFFLFTILLILGYGIWNVEHTFRTVNYSEFRYCLTHHNLATITFKGNRVIAQHVDGDSYETTVPDPEKLISELQEKDIQIIFKKDRSDQIFQGITLLYIILLCLTVVISLLKKKKIEDDNRFASDKLILPDEPHKAITFDDVTGIPEALEELQEIVSF